MAVDVSGLTLLGLYYDGKIKRIVEEIMEVGMREAKLAYENQRNKSNTRSTGALFASFQETPILVEGLTRYKGMVIVGGPSAPYAPIVEEIGWDTLEGHKEAYHFMRIGADRAREQAVAIAIRVLGSAV